MNTSQLILDYADSRSHFRLSELAGYIRNHEYMSDSAILWHIKRLIKQNRLFRLARGIYGKSSKNTFIPQPSEEITQISKKIKKAFPFVDFIAYSGNEISALQHHISSNNAIYIEVEKDAAETVFHFLHDLKFKVFYRPSADFLNDYVDLGEKVLIVKQLTSESPIIKTGDVSMPSLEKILVDINTDPDFFYLQDSETYYIMNNAQSLYNVNIPKLLRYASRRGLKAKIQTILNCCSNTDCI